MNEKQILKSKALANIIFVLADDKVLLGIKTRKIGVGKRNGYGGGVETGQTMEESAAAELLAEASLISEPKDFKKIGVVDFYNHFDDGTAKLVKCEILTLTKWSGTPKSSPEMLDPQWFPIDHLPFDDMMVADRDWVTKFLYGEVNYAEVHQTDHQTRLLQPVILKRLP